jgi:hypothetical protein
VIKFASIVSFIKINKFHNYFPTPGLQNFLLLYHNVKHEFKSKIENKTNGYGAPAAKAKADSLHNTDNEQAVLCAKVMHISLVYNILFTSYSIFF